jgi:hypothetical protein
MPGQSPFDLPQVSAACGDYSGNGVHHGALTLVHLPQAAAEESASAINKEYHDMTERSKAAPPTHAKALFDWDKVAGAARDDLHFEAGDILKCAPPSVTATRDAARRRGAHRAGGVRSVVSVEEPGDGWLTAQRGDVVGILPANFVQLLVRARALRARALGPLRRERAQPAALPPPART